MAGMRDAFLKTLYAKLPVLGGANRWARVGACVGLSAASFTILYVLGVVLLVLGVAFFTTNPGWLNFLALIPGLLVLVDKKAGLADYGAYLLLSWLAMAILGGIFVMLIWMVGA